MAGVPHLKQLSQDFRERGFEIIASTNEDPAKVADWLAKNPLNYGVVSKAPGVSAYVRMGQGLPRGWVISADGKILFSGKPANITSAMVEEWLKDCPAAPIDRPVVRELKKAVSQYNSGKYGKALVEAEKFESDENGKVAEDAKFVAEKVRRAIGWRKEEATRLRQDGRLTRLLDLLEQDARGFEGAAYADECAAEAKTVKASEKYKTCKAAETMLARILERKDLKGPALVRELDKVIEKYADTPAARDAAAMKAESTARYE